MNICLYFNEPGKHSKHNNNAVDILRYVQLNKESNDKMTYKILSNKQYILSSK